MKPKPKTSFGQEPNPYDALSELRREIFKAIEPTMVIILKWLTLRINRLNGWFERRKSR